MKNLYKLTLLLLVGALLPISGQMSLGAGEEAYLFSFPSPDSLLNKVLVNNRSLKAARELYEVNILSARTGITPPDPQVEISYLVGTPSEIGNRTDFSVSQQFDFPTAYIHMSRARDLKQEKAELQYTLARQDILLQAMQLWLERIYLNQQESILFGRLTLSEKIVNHYREMMTAGESGQLSYSQSRLQTTALRSEYERTAMKIRSNQLALEEICGGEVVDVQDRVYPPAGIYISDSILQAYRSSSEMQLIQRNMELKAEQKSLSVSQNLPKLTAGYYSETVLNLRYKGFQVGFSVPLWENASKVKKAKSELLFAEADAARYESLQQMEVVEKIDRLASLRSQVEEIEGALGEVNDERLLNLAFEAGEISLSEYFYASELYFRNVSLLLEMRRDQLLLEAELMRVYL